MNVQDFQFLTEREFARIASLSKTKGADYRRGEDDAFANFKRAAAALSLTPEQVWGVYASKHWDAVMNYCRGDHTESEPIEDRLRDLILYCLLLMGRVQDVKNETLAQKVVS